jgi:hypothetical protein
MAGRVSRAIPYTPVILLQTFYEFNEEEKEKN